jgi:glycine/D-amino acid oxidase-like deaminating enzyme
MTTYLSRVKQYDYLIVGQGITGSVMALTLLRRGKSVLVIDKPVLSSSSRIAAGVYNPFNFRQMMNNWKAKEMVASAKELYRYAGKISGQKIFTERKILKIFTSRDERILWEHACVEKSGLLADENILENPFGESVITPYGIGVVNDGGSIDTGMLIYCVSELLKEQNSYSEEIFYPELLQVSADEIRYADRFSAAHVIFCEGHLNTGNPWFKFIPIKPAKGQLLHVHIPDFSLTEVLNRGCYLLPLGNDRFVLGSTFDNDAVDEKITAAAKEDLLSRVQKFLRIPIRVESQFAGIRPAVQDRRPVVGTHPEFRNLSILNGMGSKAVLLSPWLAERLVENIENGKALPMEVDVERFGK